MYYGYQFYGSQHQVGDWFGCGYDCPWCRRNNLLACACGYWRKAADFCLCERPRHGSSGDCAKCGLAERAFYQNVVDCSEFHAPRVSPATQRRHELHCYGCYRARSDPSDCLQEEWDRRRGNEYRYTRRRTYFVGRKKAEGGEEEEGEKDCGICRKTVEACACFES
jgi:hypothetical protein